MAEFLRKENEGLERILWQCHQCVTSVSPVVSPVAFSVQLTERQMAIVKMIQNKDRVSAAEMSLVLSVSLKTVKRDLKEMQNKGIITHEGNTSAGRWVILQNNDNESYPKGQ